MATTRRDFMLGAAGAGIFASCGPRGVGEPTAGSAGRASATPPRRGMVASSQRLASDAGAAILHAGGNAADAAIAMAAVLAVTEPTSTGLGGDCFALYYDGRTREVSGLNGSGRAPAALSLDRLRAEGIAQPGPTHGHAVTVPGACAGWCDLH